MPELSAAGGEATPTLLMRWVAGFIIIIIIVPLILAYTRGLRAAGDRAELPADVPIGGIAPKPAKWR